MSSGNLEKLVKVAGGIVHVEGLRVHKHFNIRAKCGEEDGIKLVADKDDNASHAVTQLHTAVMRSKIRFDGRRGSGTFNCRSHGYTSALNLSEIYK
jgi:hypothetical protein